MWKNIFVRTSLLLSPCAVLFLVGKMNAKQYDDDKALKAAKERAVAILIDSDVTLQDSLTELQRAKELAKKAGLNVESYIVKPTESATYDGANSALDTVNMNVANAYTGGHSNTDHVVVTTGDDKIDRIAELKRNLLRVSISSKTPT